MNKIKLLFIFVLLVFTLIIASFFFLKPATNTSKNTSVPQTTVNPENKNQNMKNKNNKNVISSEISEISTIKNKLNKIDNVSNKNISDKKENSNTIKDLSSLSDEEKEFLVFTRNFGRNIFQEKIELDTPVPIITQYENPDIDGNIILSWKNIKDAETYSIELNGKVIDNVRKPYQLKNLKDGKYSLRLIAKNKNGNSKWCNPVLLKVRLKHVENKIKREVINIKVNGIVSRGGKFNALIDDKIYEVGDELAGGTIKSISLNELILEKNGLIYKFKVKE